GSNCPSGTLPCGDGGQATAAQLFTTGGITVGPDGSLYIADGNLGRVRRVRPDGIIVNFAGNGTVCSSSTALCGDGGPATQAQFRGSIDVALGVDGSVYVPDINSGRVRRIGPDGIITTVAGNGATSGTGGDGGFPVAAELGTPRAVAVGPDGRLYV